MAAIPNCDFQALPAARGGSEFSFPLLPALLSLPLLPLKHTRSTPAQGLTLGCFLCPKLLSPLSITRDAFLLLQFLIPRPDTPTTLSKSFLHQGLSRVWASPLFSTVCLLHWEWGPREHKCSLSSVLVLYFLLTTGVWHALCCFLFPQLPAQWPHLRCWCQVWDLAQNDMSRHSVE
jgi:hypothetical protein